MQKRPPNEGREAGRGLESNWPLLSDTPDSLAQAPIEHCGTGSTLLAITLHAPVRQDGARYSGTYSVSVNGEVIVAGSRDPECDASRALLSRGIHGKAKVIDAVTGAHRSTVDIQKASKLTVKEGGHGPYFSKWRLSERSPAPESEEVGL